MAEEQDQDQKTEAPTQKRKDDALKEGNFLTSKELATAVTMIAGTAWILGLGALFFDAAQVFLTKGLSLDLSNPDRFEPMNLLLDPLAQLALPFSGLLLMTLFAAVAAPAILGSLRFSGKAFSFKGSRINPLSGLKRIFGVQGLIELVKAIAKVAVLGYGGFWIISNEITNLPGLANADPKVAVGLIGEKLAFTIGLLTAALVLIAAIDVPAQWFQRNRKLLMTKQQVKDELRQTDGAPELKQSIRARQQELAMSSARKGVAEANVVLTNPTHFAVAIRYRPGLDAAPVVVARGRGDIAMAIKAMAREQNVISLQYPQLTRAIYFTTLTGRAISEDLYAALAAILAFVFQLEAALDKNLVQPSVEVPITMHFDQDGLRMA